MARWLKWICQVRAVQLESGALTVHAPSVSRLHAWLLGVPVYVKVMGIALGMVMLLGAGMLWQVRRAWHDHLIGDVEQRGQDLAMHISGHLAGLYRSGQAGEISAELRHALEESVDVVYLVLQTGAGDVLAEARSRDPAPSPGQLRQVAVMVGPEAHRLLVGLSTAHVDREVAWLTRRLSGLTVVIGCLGLASAWWLSRILARPIEELVNLTRAVKAGRYQGRAPVRATDEVGELALAFNEMTGTLAEKEELRQELLRRVIRAGEEERKRIARELHDHTGQALTSLIAGLSALETQTGSSAMRDRLLELRQQIERTLEEVHDLSVALRPSVLDDIGLMAALERHCGFFAKSAGIQVRCDDIGLDGSRLPADVELTVYRVAQEALTNAVRHGRATRVGVLVRHTAAGVLVSIQDNGSGFDARDWHKHCVAESHLGLLGIEERVSLLGGEFCVESAPGQGTTVYADIPIASRS